MSFTTKEIQSQKVLMEQEISKLSEELKVKQNEYKAAFGNLKGYSSSKFKTIMISCVVGVGVAIILIVTLKKYYPGFVPF